MDEQRARAFLRIACLALAAPHGKTPGEQKLVAEGMLDWVLENSRAIDTMAEGPLRDAAMLAFGGKTGA